MPSDLQIADYIILYYTTLSEIQQHAERFLGKIPLSKLAAGGLALRVPSGGWPVRFRIVLFLRFQQSGIVQPQAVHHLVVVVTRGLLRRAAERVGVCTLYVDLAAALPVEKRVSYDIIKIVPLVPYYPDSLSVWPLWAGSFGVIDVTGILHQKDPTLSILVPDRA